MDLEGLIAEHKRFGAIVHLATVTPGGDPHVAPVHADWQGGRLYVMVGTDALKTRNIAANPSVALHYQVSEATGWDSLMLWGRASVLESLEDKRRLWEGVFSYDLNLFSPGGPDSLALDLLHRDSAPAGGAPAPVRHGRPGGVAGRPGVLVHSTEEWVGALRSGRARSDPLTGSGDDLHLAPRATRRP